MSVVDVADVDDPVHVLPVNDSRPHFVSRSCDCAPRMIWRREGVEHLAVIFVHYAWDGRE